MRGRAGVARWLGCALVVCAAELPPATAQTPPASGGVIRGTISTQQTTPLPGVDVKVIDATGRIVAAVSSDREGRFQINSLTAGTYRVMAALDGFETTTVSVVVTHEGAASITVDLPIARFADTIDVVGETTAVSGGQTLAPVEAIASRELDQFVPGQGFQGAVRMLATVIPVAGGVSIKGGRPGQAGVQLGTATLVDPASGVAQVPLPDDAIDSVTVLPNPYAVEYGRFSSGLVLIRTRRATDVWQTRINKLDPSFRTTRGNPFDVVGISAFSPRFETGGPLVKDRVFLQQAAQYQYRASDVQSRPLSELRTSNRFSSFTRVDANLTPKHLLIAAGGWFPANAKQATLGTFIPPEATVDTRGRVSTGSFTERSLWSDEIFTETTAEIHGYETSVSPGFAADAAVPGDDQRQLLQPTASLNRHAAADRNALGYAP